MSVIGIFRQQSLETECHFNFDLSRNRHAILRSRLKLPCLDSIFSVLILLQRVVQLSYFTFLAYWNAFVGVEENFGSRAILLRRNYEPRGQA